MNRSVVTRARHVGLNVSDFVGCCADLRYNCQGNRGSSRGGTFSASPRSEPDFAPATCIT